MNPLRDLSNLRKALSVRKLRNVYRITNSYKKSIKNLQAEIKGMPISISIEPTTSCNLRCPECLSGQRAFTRNRGMLTPELFTKIIDEIHPDLVYLILYFQGESFLNPNFFDFIDYASSKRIYTICSTNGHYLSEENCLRVLESGLSRLIVSIDGARQESYQTYRRGGNLDVVLQGVKRLLIMRKKFKNHSPFVEMQSILFSSNEDELANLQKLSRELGVDKFQGPKSIQGKLEFPSKQDPLSVTGWQRRNAG